MRLDPASNSVALVILAASALLEVGGDAVIRKGLRSGGLALVVLGCVVLAAYGVVVNLLRIDFTRLLGAYVGVFALTSVVLGKVLFAEKVATSTWVGVTIVLVGSLVIQYG